MPESFTTDDIADIPAFYLRSQFLGEIFPVYIKLDAPGHILDHDERAAAGHDPAGHPCTLAQLLKLFLGLVAQPILQFRGQHIASEMIGERNPILTDTGQLLAPLGDEFVFVLLLIGHKII